MSNVIYTKPRIKLNLAMLGLGFVFIALGYFEYWNGELVFDLPPRWFEFIFLHQTTCLFIGFAVGVSQLFIIANKALQALHAVPISRLLLPGQLSQNKIANQTSWWRHLDVSPVGSKQLKLERGALRMRFIASSMEKLSAWMFIFVGASIFALVFLPPQWFDSILPDHNPSWLLQARTIQERLSLTNFEISTKVIESSIILVVALLTLATGILSLVYSRCAITFDKSSGYFWFGLARKKTNLALSMDKSAILLERIYALQIIDGESVKELQKYFDKSQKTDHCGNKNFEGSISQLDNQAVNDPKLFELNLILDDGQRVHINTYRDKHQLTIDAAHLADFLQVTVWQGSSL